MASRTLIVAALAAASSLAAHAQQTVTITGRSAPPAGLTGFGDSPPARTPIQAAVYGNGLLLDSGVTQLSGLTRLDASIGDAYNAEGYWSNLTVRGFVIDNRFNYRRDGLPINAETALPLDNKDRLEVLKGTSGIQAGTSAPGGLVNLVVKRPTGRVASARIEARQSGTVGAAVDLGNRFGSEGRFGLRANVAAEHLDPVFRNTRGDRWLASLAGDWQIAADTLLQAEIESSHQRQPSVAGFSMLGNTVPSAASIDPRINLNHQPWSLPVVLDGSTASLKLQQRLSADWRFTAHAMQQRLKSDDRTAFPYGVYDPATYKCAQWCDRFAPDGTFTYWQYVSDGERRTSSALSLQLDGQLSTGGVKHALATGVLLTRYRGRFNDQIFDIAGTGRIDGSLTTPPSPGFPDANTNRDEKSTELFARDAMQLARDWQLWAGLRHVRLERDAVRTSPDSDGSLRATHYERQATTPWLALAWQIQDKTMLYASWGKGLETDVAPNRARYANAGESLALQSRQSEVGIKHGSDRVEAALTLFQIERTRAADIGDCNAPGSCRYQIDGSQRHRGIEAQGAFELGAFTLNASAMLLDAVRRGSVQAGVNGGRPENVPARSLRLGGEWRPLPALALQAALVAEGNRVVLPYDQGARIPGWARVDLGARWRQGVTTWRLGVDNAADRRAWKESPYQFGHAYLYPLAPRTWRVSAQFDL